MKINLRVLFIVILGLFCFMPNHIYAITPKASKIKAKITKKSAFNLLGNSIQGIGMISVANQTKKPSPAQKIEIVPTTKPQFTYCPVIVTLGNSAQFIKKDKSDSLKVVYRQASFEKGGTTTSCNALTFESNIIFNKPPTCQDIQQDKVKEYFLSNDNKRIGITIKIVFDTVSQTPQLHIYYDSSVWKKSDN